MAKVKACVSELSGKSFEEKIKRGTILVDFFAEWCMPCLMMTPVIDEMAEKFDGKIDFCKVNIDENASLADKFSVMSIPTLIVFKNGKEIDRLIGSQPADVLEEKLRKFV